MSGSRSSRPPRHRLGGPLERERANGRVVKLAKSLRVEVVPCRIDKSRVPVEPGSVLGPRPLSFENTPGTVTSPTQVSELSRGLHSPSRGHNRRMIAFWFLI